MNDFYVDGVGGKHIDAITCSDGDITLAIMITDTEEEVGHVHLDRESQAKLARGLIKNVEAGNIDVSDVR